MECIHLNFLTDNKGKKFLSPSLPNSDLNGKILKVIISDGSTKRVYPVFQQKAGVYGEASEYILRHGCACCSLTTALAAFVEKYAKAFSGKVEEVKQACTCLGGKQTERLAGADLTFEMPVLPGFSVLLQFWDGDEEFLPKILLLWDKVSLSYLHFETTYYLQGDLLKTILQTIG